MIEDLVQAKPGAIEAFLHTLQYKLARHKAEKQFLQQQHHQQQQSYQQQHYQQQQTLGMGMDGTFAAGTCIIDGEEALVGTGGIDSSDPHVPAHQHAFHLHPYPHPPASPSTSSAFAASPGGHHHHHHHRATGASTAASASASGSPRRQHFVHPEGGESHLPSPFDRPATAAAGATPASLQMMGAATERRVGGAGAKEAVRREVDEEILLEKEETIQELRETVELLELKLSKLEQLLRLKDGKIERLSDELARLALGGGDGAQAGGAEEEGEEEGGAALGLGDEH